MVGVAVKEISWLKGSKAFLNDILSVGKARNSLIKKTPTPIYDKVLISYRVRVFLSIYSASLESLILFMVNS